MESVAPTANYGRGALKYMSAPAQPVSPLPLLHIAFTPPLSLLAAQLHITTTVILLMQRCDLITVLHKTLQWFLIALRINKV